MNDPPFNAYHVSGLDLHAYLRAILTPEEYREVIRRVEEKTKAGSEGTGAGAAVNVTLATPRGPKSPEP